MQSESVGKLAEALAKAQAVMIAPKKGKTAKLGTYSYAYADLADIIESYRKPLADNGLALSQTMRDAEGHVILETCLIHLSGEWIRSEFPVTIFTKPQETGSAITYARRYAVTALLGIAAEDDDDGAAAQGGTPKAAKDKQAKDWPRPAEPPASTSKPSVITRPEIEQAHTLAKKAGLATIEEFRKFLIGLCDVEKVSELSRQEFTDLLDVLRGMADANGSKAEVEA